MRAGAEHAFRRDLTSGGVTRPDVSGGCPAAVALAPGPAPVARGPTRAERRRDDAARALGL
jgi:hypothetical protein